MIAAPAIPPSVGKIQNAFVSAPATNRAVISAGNIIPPTGEVVGGGTMVGTNNPPGSEIVPTVGSASNGPLSCIVIVMVLALILMGTDTHVPPTNLRYCVPGGTALGNVTITVILLAGANPVIDHEKKPKGYEPDGGGGDKLDSETAVKLLNPPASVENVTGPAPVADGTVNVDGSGGVRVTVADAVSFGAAEPGVLQVASVQIFPVAVAVSVIVVLSVLVHLNVSDPLGGKLAVVAVGGIALVRTSGLQLGSVIAMSLRLVEPVLVST